MSLGAHTSTHVSAHKSFGGQTSAHESFGAHTSAHTRENTSLGAHTSTYTCAGMSVFLPPGPYHIFPFKL